MVRAKRNRRIANADACSGLRSDADAGSGRPRRGRRRPACHATSACCCICRAVHVPLGPAPGATRATVNVRAAATRRAAHRSAGEQQGETRARFFCASSSSTACARLVLLAPARGVVRECLPRPFPGPPAEGPCRPWDETGAGVGCRRPVDPYPYSCAACH